MMDKTQVAMKKLIMLAALVALLVLAGCAPAANTTPTEALAKATTVPTAQLTPLPTTVQPTLTVTFLPSATPMPPTPRPTAALSPDAKAVKVPLRALALQFLDPQNGYLVGDTAPNPPPSTFGLARSGDGGRTWQALPLLAAGMALEYPVQGGFLFTSLQEGWFFFQGLYSTRNGGLTWMDEKPKGRIASMGKASDGTVFALEQTGGVWKTWLVKGAYAGWQPLLARLPDGLTEPALSVGSASAAWVLQPVEMKASLIYATTDGGKTWSQLKSPCSEHPSAVGGWLAAVDAKFLWLGCGVPAGMGSGSKFIFTSADGGKSWALKGKGALPPQADNTLSTRGYFDGIQALSPQFAYMTWQRTQAVMVTRDSGQNWESFPLRCSAEFDRVFFVDPMNGWVYDQNCLNSTTDGGKTWTCSLLPDGKPCP